jgi:hypothetical protein
VVARTEGKVSVDDLSVDVGTTIKWFLEKYGGRMRSGYIWIKRGFILKILTKFNLRRGEFLEYLRMF